MAQMNRRQFVYSGLTAAAVAAAGNAQGAERKFTIAFIPGSIGIKADQGRSIELAAKYGFESVQPFGRQLLQDGVARYVEALRSNKLNWPRPVSATEATIWSRLALSDRQMVPPSGVYLIAFSIRFVRTRSISPMSPDTKEPESPRSFLAASCPEGAAVG